MHPLKLVLIWSVVSFLSAKLVPTIGNYDPPCVSEENLPSLWLNWWHPGGWPKEAEDHRSFEIG
jgi:hypothetical protein